MNFPAPGQPFRAQEWVDGLIIGFKMRRGANLAALNWCTEKPPMHLVRREIADNKKGY
jgi:hypothetical protein